MTELQHRPSRKADPGMWQRLLDRFAPVMDEPPSRLDSLDGVGGGGGGHAGAAGGPGPESVRSQQGGSFTARA